MKAFHGTYNEFSTFSAEYLGQNTDGNATNESFAETARFGFWFCDNELAVANVYDKVMACELAIENPMTVDSLDSLANWIECTGQTAAELREWCINNGYDGIKVEYDEEFEGTSYIAFSPEQITIL